MMKSFWEQIALPSLFPLPSSCSFAVLIIPFLVSVLSPCQFWLCILHYMMCKAVKDCACFGIFVIYSTFTTHRSDGSSPCQRRNKFHAVSYACFALTCSFCPDKSRRFQNPLIYLYRKPLASSWFLVKRCKRKINRIGENPN